MAAAIGDVFRIICKMQNGVDDVQNVYHAKMSGTTAFTDLEVTVGLEDALDSAYNNIDGAMDNDLTFSTISIYNLTQDLFLSERAWPTMVAGSGVGGELPPQCAPLMLFPTATLRSIGKKFLPPFAEEALDADGTITAGPLAAMAAFGAALLFGVVGLEAELHFGNYRPTGSIFIPWTSAVVRDLWATQRRRYISSGS